MNLAQLVHVWKKAEAKVAQPEGFAGAPVNSYELFLTTDDLEFAQQLCTGQNGVYVYTFESAFYID